MLRATSLNFFTLRGPKALILPCLRQMNVFFFEKLDLLTRDTSDFVSSHAWTAKT